MRVFCESVFAATSQTSQTRTKGRRRCCRPGLIDVFCMYLESSRGVHRLETASEGDPRARGNVGSGDLADRKTTAGPPEVRLGPPQVPHRRGRGGRWARRWPRRRQALCRLARKEAVPGAGKPGRYASWMSFSGGMRSPGLVSPHTTGRAGPTAGPTHRIWRRERKVRPLLQSKVRRVETY